MEIDEDHEYTPYSTEGTRIIYSDHHMINIRCDWILKSKEKAPQNMYMGAKEYKNYENELNMSNISDIIDENNFENSYQAWSDKVMEIARKHSKKVKKRTPWKSNRLLMTAKKRVQKKLRDRKSLSPKNKKMLLMRKKLIMEHIIDEDRKKHHHVVNKVVEKIKNDGGLDSTAFWTVQK